MKRMPTTCPSCEGKLSVKRLRCEACETEVDGLYALPALANLNQDEQEFILKFIQASGSLKAMADHMNLSYPTVRNLLDEIIEKLNKSLDNKKGKK